VPSREVRRDDGDLIDAARRGDANAFGSLVEAHQHEVYTLALRLVGEREMAADVAQEAFVRAWRAMPNFRGDARFGTWMHRITVNTAWTMRRRELRRRHEELDPDRHAPEAAGVDPLEMIEAADARPRLMAALDELSPSVRIVVVLKDVYDWSHGEIATHLGITVTAAKVRLHRGRKQLRDLLWEERRRA